MLATSRRAHFTNGSRAERVRYRVLVGMPKSMTLRLSDEQVTMLGLVARTDGQTVTAVIRSAIDAHIAARRRDEDFRARLRALYERERAIYERLAG